MSASEAQIVAVHAEFRDSEETPARWADSHCLDHLLAAARSFGALLDVDVFPLLDEDDRDLVLVSVELRPGAFAHAAPTQWCELRPAPGVLGASAIRHVLARIDEVADAVRAAHGEGVRA